MLFGLFVARRAHWSESDGARPVHPDAAEISLRDFHLLADGLTLLFARCSEDVLNGALRDAVAVHRRISSALQRGCPVQVPGKLLSEVAGTIEPLVDRATSEAARRCVEHVRSGH